MKKSFAALFSAAVVILIMLFIFPSFAAETKTSGFFEYRVLDGGTAEIVRYLGSAEKVTVPQTLDGLTVSKIGEKAFFESDTLTYVSLPNSVKEIKKSAFEDCRLLNEVKFSSSLQKIEDRAFFSCLQLQEVNLPDTLTEIGALAFGETEAAYINFPKNLQKIGYNPFDDTPFSNNQNIGGIYWGTWLIGYEDFPHGTDDEDITIRETTTGIADNVFSPEAKGHHPYNLKSVTIPEKVKYIGKKAFAESRFSSIVIPSSVVYIGEGAFENCSALKTVSLSKNVQYIGANAFSNTAAVNAQKDEIKYIGNWIVQTANTEQSIEIKKNVIGIAEDSFLGSPEKITVFKNVKYISPHAFGYYKIGGVYKKIASFKLKCERNSAAKKYAQSNTLSFESFCLHERISGWKTDKKATASAAGSKHKECLDCKKVIQKQKIPMKKCAAPVLSKIKNTKDGVHITWKKTAGAKYYIVYRKSGNNSSWKRLASTKSRFYTDKTALIPFGQKMPPEFQITDKRDLRLPQDDTKSRNSRIIISKIKNGRLTNIVRPYII